MREFYFEDKVGHFSIIGASPHDDVNCKPLDYFTYNHAYVVARTFMQVASYKKDLSNIDERYFFEFALEQTKENNDRIQYSTYPQAGLQQILAHHEWDKHQQKKLWKGIILSAIDIWWFNWLAQEIGYLLDVFHIEIIPKAFKSKKMPMCFTHEKNGSFRKIGTTDLSEGEMRGILEQRKVLQMRIYHKDNTWHCFYFTHRGLAGKEPGAYGSVPHYHYISDKFGIPLTDLKKHFANGKMPSSEIHIQIKNKSKKYGLMPTVTVLEIHDAVYAWLPNIMQIAEIPEDKLNKKIAAYIKQVTSLHPDTLITRLHSMFSMVNSAANGCMFYQDFLSYYDEQAKNLYENICQGNQTWQKKVKAKLEQSVLDISDKNVTNPSNPAFLNYIAEILYAATIIPRAQDGGYEFLGFDVSMNNGKDADLQFRRIDDGMLIYFDNLSIHGVDISKVDQSEDLYNYLKTKLDQKIASKTSGLVKENENYIINGAVSEFHVAPILWNESCDMLPHKDAFQQFENEKTVSGLFVALKPQYLSNGRFYFSIDKIKNILQHWEEQLTTIDND